MHSAERIRNVTDARQRLGVVAELPGLLAERGVDVGRWLADQEIDRRVFESPDNILPLATVTRILNAAAKAADDPDLGLALGAMAEPRHLGAVGRFLETASTFGEALVDFVTCHGKYVRGGAPYLLAPDAESLLLGYRLYEPGLPGARSWSLGVTAFAVALFRRLGCGQPDRVLISLAPPRTLRAYRTMFGPVDMKFEAQHHGLVYPRAALSRRIPTADLKRHEELRRLIGAWVPLQPDLRDQVLRILLPSILAGEASLSSTAERLCMHPRALNRQLQAKGVSFRDLLNEARFEIARQLLEETNISVQELSSLFGYSEVSAFSRFFVAKSGFPPTKWRETSSVRANA